MKYYSTMDYLSYKILKMNFANKVHNKVKSYAANLTKSNSHKIQKRFITSQNITIKLIRIQYNLDICYILDTFNLGQKKKDIYFNLILSSLILIVFLKFNFLVHFLQLNSEMQIDENLKATRKNLQSIYCELYCFFIAQNLRIIAANV